MNHVKLTVTGMTCAACSARVERAVSALDGATDVSVNLLTGDLRVAGVSEEAVVAAVTAAGYGIDVPRANDSALGAKDNALRAKDNVLRSDSSGRAILVRFLVSLAVLLPLMWLSMGGMLGLPRPLIFDANPAVLGLAELLLSAVILLINHRFFTGGVRAAWHLSPNMDTLVSLGSGVGVGSGKTTPGGVTISTPLKTLSKQSTPSAESATSTLTPSIFIKREKS